MTPLPSNSLIYDENRKTLVAKGDEAFLNKIRNFIANHVFTRKHDERGGEDGSLFFHVSEDDLFAGLAKEGYGIRMSQLWHEKLRAQPHNDDLPDNIDELVREYNRKVLSGDETAVSPIEPQEETQDMIDEAQLFGLNYAQTKMDEIERIKFFAGMTNLGIEEHSEGGFDE